MARQVLVNADHVSLPDGNVYNTGDVVSLTGEQFSEISPTALGTEVTDQGFVADTDDEVVDNAVHVASIADPATATAADVANKINEVIAALSGPGKPMAAS